MRPADEIKKGLECCSHVGRCMHGCPYYINNNQPACTLHKSRDALAHIQQLEDQNAEKAERIRALESRNNALYHTILGVMHFVDKWLDVPAYDPDEDLNGTTAVGRASHAREIALQAIEQLEAERDALVADIRMDGGLCSICKYADNMAHSESCRHCNALVVSDHSNWQWRGVQKEDSDA